MASGSWRAAKNLFIPGLQDFANPQQTPPETIIGSDQLVNTNARFGFRWVSGGPQPTQQVTEMAIDLGIVCHNLPKLSDAINAIWFFEAVSND